MKSRPRLNSFSSMKDLITESPYTYPEHPREISKTAQLNGSESLSCKIADVCGSPLPSGF